jgi:hypothetical protein
VSSTTPSAKADALTEGSAAADASGFSPATAEVATLLNRAQQATGAALKALERSDQAQRDAMAPLRELHLRVAGDAAAFGEMLEAAGVELTKKLDNNRALAAVKAAAPTMDDKHASFLARVLNGLEARGVAPGDAPAFIAENGGMVAVAKMAPKATKAGDKAGKQFKKDCKLAESVNLGRAPEVDLPVEPGDSGFLVVLAKPGDDGGLTLHGAVSDDKVVAGVVKKVVDGAFNS